MKEVVEDDIEPEPVQKKPTFTTGGGDGLIFNPYLQNVFDEIDSIK